MRRHFAMACALIVLFGGGLAAKGPTTKIVITGPDLRTPIAITDSNVLKDFTPWDGPGTFSVSAGVQTEGKEGFIIDWSAGALPEKPVGLHHYEVTFFESGDRPTYVVPYDWSPASGRGYVFLPKTALNLQTISRGLEEKWFHASAKWQRVVVPLLESAVQ